MPRRNAARHEENLTRTLRLLSLLERTLTPECQPSSGSEAPFDPTIDGLIGVLQRWSRSSRAGTASRPHRHVHDNAEDPG